jgi:glutamyl-tRNA reductase
VKQASTEFGEFNALSAQEKDCLERLEKKLNRCHIISTCHRCYAF